MGKRLIIKGADFSANGFTYHVETEIVKDLWYKGTGQGSLVKNTTHEWPISVSDGRAYYKNVNASDTYFMLTNMDDCMVSNKVAVGDFTHVKVRTLVNWSNQNSYFVILAAIDANEKLLGGYRSHDTDDDSVLTDVGISANVREFEMDIPAGATHIIATWSGANSSPFDVDNGYYMELSKIVE